MGWFSTNYNDNKKPIGDRAVSRDVEARRAAERRSADVEASERREAAAAAGAARQRDKRIRQWKTDVAKAQAAVVRLEAIPEARRNARQLRKAKKRLRDLRRSHG